MKSSSAFFTICNIREQIRHPKLFINYTDTTLHNYQVGLSPIRLKVYISAEVHPDSLDKGYDLTDESRLRTRADGVKGDEAAYFIGKKLGGVNNPRNVFPINSQLDTTAWKADEDKVYQHVKQGGKLYALLMYGIEIDSKHKDELRRPAKIYRHFQLYEDGNVVGPVIDGVFENISPKRTMYGYYRDRYNRPISYDEAEKEGYFEQEGFFNNET